MRRRAAPDTRPARTPGSMFRQVRAMSGNGLRRRERTGSELPGHNSSSVSPWETDKREACPILGAKRERQSVGRCGQKGSDGVSEAV
jgi:hypothetical protein